jgi:hypothetical protein
MTVQRPGTRPLGVYASSPAYQHHRGRRCGWLREAPVRTVRYEWPIRVDPDDQRRRAPDHQGEGVTNDNPVRHHHDPAGVVRHRVGRKEEAPRRLRGVLFSRGWNRRHRRPRRRGGRRARHIRGLVGGVRARRRPVGCARHRPRARSAHGTARALQERLTEPPFIVSAKVWVARGAA